MDIDRNELDRYITREDDTPTRKVRCLIITDPLGRETTDRIIEQLAEATETDTELFDVVGHYEYVSDEAIEKAEHVDAMLIDYGGMAVGATDMVASQIRWVCEWAKEHPGKIAILLTMFTAEVYSDELEREFGDCDNILAKYHDENSGDNSKISSWINALAE